MSDKPITFDRDDEFPSWGEPSGKIYLAGPMEYAEDVGRAWRAEATEKLGALGYQCINPEQAETHIATAEEMVRLKREDIREYVRKMRRIIDLDTETVASEVDFVICNWEGEPSSGTMAEALVAYDYMIPFYLVTSLPLEEVPGWFLSCCTEVHPSLDSLIEARGEQWREALSEEERTGVCDQGLG
jgi:nucleoside 2-deoxyribosyltransferase